MTRKLVGALALVAMAGSASADVLCTDIHQNWSAPIDQIASGQFGSRAPSPGSIYSNIDNPTGFYIKQGAATSLTGGTHVIADKVTTVGNLAPLGATQTGLTKFTFSMVNGNSVSVSCRPRIRFWAADGVGGAPGTALLGISFNPITIAANTAASYFSDFSTFAWGGGFGSIGGNIWIGTLFDGASSTITLAQLNNMGILAYDAPGLGTSADQDFITTTPGSNFQNNPVGSQRTSPFAGAPVANYLYELAPTPGSLAVLGLGGLVAARRRRAH